MSAEPVPNWLRPPVGGFKAADLDTLPELPPHTELIDGGLVFVSPQREFHDSTGFLLRLGLSSTCPSTWRVRQNMSIVLQERQRLEPDVSVIRAEASRADATWYPASDVLLAVEIVSPESEIRDRQRKPQLYAEAGIPHFWRIEEADHKPVVYVYELDAATRSYVPTGIHHDRLKLSVPFDIDVDLNAVASM